MAFATQLAAHRSVEVALPAEKTVARLNAVIHAQPTLSKRVRQFLASLVAYWGSVSDLAQRQEHSASRENEALEAEDARRVVFQTMLVMYEVDTALSKSRAA